MKNLFLSGFKLFVERKLRSLDNNKPENHLDALSRELSISPNDIPDLLQVSPFQLEDKDICFNTIVLKVKKPIELNDPFVTLYIDPIKSPNLNQNIYICSTKQPYSGNINDLIHFPIILPMQKFSELFSRAWQGLLANNNTAAAFPGQF